MATKLAWDDGAAQSIIRCEFQGRFEVEDYAIMEHEFPMMILDVPHRVDVIAILSPGAALPRHLLHEIPILVRVLPPNFGEAVGIGSGFLLTNPISVGVAALLLRTTAQPMRSKLHVVRSLQAARQLIARRRAHHQPEMV